MLIAKLIVDLAISLIQNLYRSLWLDNTTQPLPLASPSTNQQHLASNDSDNDEGIKEGSQGSMSIANEEMEEVETNIEGHIGIRGPKGGEEEGYPHEESLEIKVNKEIGEVGIEVEGGMEIGGPSEGFLLDVGPRYY
jgi:hypothetical protein